MRENGESRIVFSAEELRLCMDALERLGAVHAIVRVQGRSPTRVFGSERCSVCAAQASSIINWFAVATRHRSTRHLKSRLAVAIEDRTRVPPI